ncbi:MAG: hypothetical protein BGO49_24720 [Planctomycetales bacterium 71-10]|nr:MAG: hypothetical protein BGO49_24720 [Planctomycetales bacterium 71-10]
MSAPPLTPSEIEALGIRVYGRFWQARMAEEFGCSQSTIHRWMRPTPTGEARMDAISRWALRRLAESAKKDAGRIK